VNQDAELYMLDVAHVIVCRCESVCKLDDKLREMDREITVNPLYIQKVLLVIFHSLHVSCGYGTLLYGCKQPTCDIARMCRVLGLHDDDVPGSSKFSSLRRCVTPSSSSGLLRTTIRLFCVGVSQMLVSKICKRVAERVHN
jgi:hypothetical protein